MKFILLFLSIISSSVALGENNRNSYIYQCDGEKTYPKDGTIIRGSLGDINSSVESDYWYEQEANSPSISKLYFLMTKDGKLVDDVIVTGMQKQMVRKHSSYTEKVLLPVGIKGECEVPVSFSLPVNAVDNLTAMKSFKLKAVIPEFACATHSEAYSEYTLVCNRQCIFGPGTCD
jgi:hypothetical protein